MKLEIKKKVVHKSERVKSVELHPNLPWILIGLYTGNVTVFDYNTQVSSSAFSVSSKRPQSGILRLRMHLSDAPNLFPEKTGRSLWSS